MLPGNTMTMMRPAVATGGGGSTGNDSFTTLLLHFDGNFNNVAVGGAGSAGSPQGGIATSATQFKFGTQSLRVVSNFVLMVNDYTYYDFGSGDFTIDWWEYRDDANDNKAVYSRVYQKTYSPIVTGYSTGGVMNCYASSNGTAWDIISGLSLGSVVANVWSHRALVRSGTSFMGFKDGVLIATQTSSLALPAATPANNYPSIGSYTTDGGANAYGITGYVDEFRLSKGIARWTSNFTPPTVAYS